ncbi:MAG: hypothetical protein M1834_008536 [Cirrosporium novae-zelandiae]|nr:MAG: hypothetical protein M1834_008536 [Cirrosporium novae-zelandiae]
MGELEQLEKDYCPPIDSALFLSIISDYDLAVVAELEAAKEVLDQIKLSAIEEDNLLFDPSGSSGFAANNGASEPTDSTPEGTTPSHNTDVTGTSLSLSSWGNEDCASRHGKGSTSSSDEVPKDYFQHCNASEEQKIVILKDMFSRTDIDEYTVKSTLRKNGWDVDRAMEELLNHVFFLDEAGDTENTVTIPKGIDGFGEDNGYHHAKGKGKGKKRNGRKLSKTTDLPGGPSSSSSSSDNISSTSKWATAHGDIDFLASRTSLTKTSVSHRYHLHGGSLSATITSLITDTISDATKYVVTDPMLEENTTELKNDFPSLPVAHVRALLILTSPSTASAHELAKALLANSCSSTGALVPNPSGGLKIILKPAPIDLSSSPPTSPTANHTGIGSALSHSTAAHLASTHSLAGTTAFNQASSAYRRAKSDHLYGAVAAYYSSVGREHATKASALRSSAADALVASQSRSDQLDLHGVSVKDGVRIAKQRVESWWDGLGEDRARGWGGSAGREFRIVTGLGRHSEGGRAKLGPAVGKMLVGEGWRVEIGSGVVVVRGKARR